MWKTAYTGSNNEHDCMLIPFNLEKNTFIKLLRLRFTNVSNNADVKVSKMSIVTKDKNGKNNVIKYGSNRGETEYIIYFPKNYYYTCNDSLLKSTYICVKFKQSIYPNDNIIVRWRCKPITYDPKIKEKVLFFNVNSLNMANNLNLILVEATIYYNILSKTFMVCFAVKNQLLVATYLENHNNFKYYDFGNEKTMMSKKINDDVASNKLRTLNSIKLYYNDLDNTFKTETFDKFVLDVNTEGSSIYIEDKNNQKSFQFRSD